MLFWKPAASGDSLLRLLTKFLKSCLIQRGMNEHTQTHNTTETLGPKLIRSQIPLMAESVGCLVESWSPDSSQVCIPVIALIRVWILCCCIPSAAFSSGKRPNPNLTITNRLSGDRNSTLYECIVVHPKSQIQGLDIWLFCPLQRRVVRLSGEYQSAVWVTWSLSRWPISPPLTGSSQITFLEIRLSFSHNASCSWDPVQTCVLAIIVYLICLKFNLKVQTFQWCLWESDIHSTSSCICATKRSIHSACFAYQLAHINYTGVNTECLTLYSLHTYTLQTSVISNNSILLFVFLLSVFLCLNMALITCCVVSAFGIGAF